MVPCCIYRVVNRRHSSNSCCCIKKKRNANEYEDPFNVNDTQDDTSDAKSWVGATSSGTSGIDCSSEGSVFSQSPPTSLRRSNSQPSRGKNSSRFVVILVDESSSPPRHALKLKTLESQFRNINEYSSVVRTLSKRLSYQRRRASCSQANEQNKLGGSQYRGNSDNNNSNQTDTKTATPSRRTSPFHDSPTAECLLSGVEEVWHVCGKNSILYTWITSPDYFFIAFYFYVYRHVSRRIC